MGGDPFFMIFVMRVSNQPSRFLQTDWNQPQRGLSFQCLLSISDWCESCVFVASPPVGGSSYKNK